MTRSSNVPNRTRNGQGRGTQTCHVVNPNTTSWSALVQWILSSYPRDVDMRTVQFDKWIEELSQGGDHFVDPERNPAVKLLDFYRGATRGSKGPRVLMSHRAEKASKTLHRVGAVNEE